MNHEQRLVAIFLKSCFKFYCEALLVVVLAASQTLFANAKDSGDAAPGAVPPSEPDYLAAELKELDVGSVKALRPDLGHALLIVLPAQNGPADRAGLRPGDVIVALNGKLAPSLDEFNDLIHERGVAPKSGLKSGARWAVVPVRLESASEETKAGSIQQHLEAYNAIAKVFGKDAFPILWARTQNNLGIAYWARVQGSRVENIDAAIKAYGAALSVFTREALAQDWAQTQRNLAIAYRARAEGYWAENIEAAIKAYEAALTVFIHEASSPVQTDAAAKSEAQPTEEKPQPASQPAEAISPVQTDAAAKSEAQPSEEKPQPASPASIQSEFRGMSSRSFSASFFRRHSHCPRNVALS